MAKKAVVFDLDGTLLDSIEDLADSMNAVMDTLGLFSYSIEDYKSFVGDGPDILVTRSLPVDRRDEHTIRKGTELVGNEYKRRWADKSKPYPGIIELLIELRRKGLKIGVLSNKRHDFTEMVITHFFPGFSFDAVEGSGNKFPKKPDPSGALDIAKRFGLKPEEIIYCGDSDTDMKTAKSAGMLAIGALWGFRTSAELLECGAYAVIEKPSDILSYLDESKDKIKG